MAKNWDIQRWLKTETFRKPDASLSDGINTLQNQVACILIFFLQLLLTKYVH